jgi:hypothetical protein
LHNLILDVEGTASAAFFTPAHAQAEEEEDTGVIDEDEINDDENLDEGEAK